MFGYVLFLFGVVYVEHITLLSHVVAIILKHMCTYVQADEKSLKSPFYKSLIQSYERYATMVGMRTVIRRIVLQH